MAIYIEDFPRLPGETHDRERFQRAIAATPDGETLYISTDHYQADSLIINKTMSIQFEKGAFMEAVDVDTDILTIEGTRETVDYVLAQPVERGAREIQLTSAPIGWQIGDLLILTDDTVRHTDGQSDVNTEIHEIASILGTTIRFRDFVRLPKAISSLGKNVYKVNPLKNVQVHNFQYQLQEGSQVGRGIFMRYVRDVKLIGIRGYRGAGSGIQVQKAMHVTVEDFEFSQPQVTGSGQGYGVQFFGGCSDIIIRNGYTTACRHAVDLDSTYDAHISHVVDYNAQGAAFVMSHNGWCSDITFEQCQTYYSSGSGFVADSQGFSNPLQCTFYHFQVIGCTVVMNNTANACVYWYSPCQDSMVRDCSLRYLSGTEGNVSTLGNAGIRLYPAKTDLLISGCKITGLRRGIALQVAGSINYDNDQSKITVRDTKIQNCDAAILCYNGRGRILRIYNLDCQQIIGKLFELNGSGTFQEFVLDGLSLTDSPNLVFHTGSYAGTIPRGQIKNIRTDRSHQFTPGSNNWTLNESALYLYGDGESVLLTGSNNQSSNNPLPNGWVEGQSLCLVTMSGTRTLTKGSNMVFQKGVSSVTLDYNRRSIYLMWRNGIWLEV